MGTTSDQFRPGGRAPTRRRVRRVASAAWIAAAAAALACGDSGGDPGERDDLERRFGRRGAQTAPDPSTGAGRGEQGRAAAEVAGAGQERTPEARAEASSDGSAPQADADAGSPRPTVEPPGAPPPASAEGSGAEEGYDRREGSAAGPARQAPAGTHPAGERAASGAGPRAPRPTGGAPSGDAAASQEVDLDALLAGAERTYASLSSLRASFVQLMEVPLLERSSTGRGTWYQKGRDRFRMDFEDPPEDEIVADGTHLWLFQPSVQPDQVIRSTLADGVSDSGAPDLLGRILSQARTAYHARYEGRESVEGVRTHLIALVPMSRSAYREVRVWIGDDRLVRRFQILEENESRRTVTLSRLEPNVPLADSLFRFTPPPGVDVFDG